VIIKLDLDADLVSKIEKLVKDGKFSDFDQFVKFALKNQIIEETGSGEGPKISATQTIRSIIDKKTQEIAKMLSDIPLEESEIASTSSPLIWSFYNRFFPVKVVVRQILHSLSSDKKWIELGDIQEESFTFAESISESLKNYEDERSLPRNKKISTGLPSPSSEINGLRGAKRKKKESKLHASKIRFQEQFVGRAIKKPGYYAFSGSCFEMGLMRVKIEGERCLISLTDNGAQFAIMENPILDKEEYNYAFTKEEAQFISNEIIPKFELEKIIVDLILSKIQNKDLTAKEIEDMFIEQKKKFYQDIVKDEKEMEKLLKEIVQERVSTMGRLSELRLVNWSIDKEGRSVYSNPIN